MDALERAQHLRRHRSGEEGENRSVFIDPFAIGILGFLLLACLAPTARAQNGVPAVDAVVVRDLQAGHVPGAVVVLSLDGRLVYRGAVGSRMIDPIVQPLAVGDIFDLASLTKVIATTTAIMQLVEAGRIDLDRPAALYWPGFAANGKGSITVRQLLTHTSGLPPDLDIASDWRGREAALALIAAIRPAHAPGEAFVYSDINFIVLGELVGRVSGESLDVYARRHIFQPLGMSDTMFNPPTARLSQIAPTDRERGRLRWGEPQDPTAFRMGGVAGHAGLFSTAGDLSRFARMLLQGGSLDGVRILRPETVALMTRAVSLPGGVRSGLGWDVASPYSACMDQAFGPQSFGQTGYTGGLVWLDPATRSFLIVLTSRLHPAGGGDVKPLRLDLARLVATMVPEPGRPSAIDCEK